MSITLIPPDSGAIYDLGSLITVKVAGDSTADAYCVLEVQLAPDQGAGLHVHRREDEIVCVLEGTCTIGDADQSDAMPVGSIIRFPRGTAHFFRNDDKSRCRLLITAVPGGLDRYFAEIAAALDAEEPDRIAAINASYQIEFFE